MPSFATLALRNLLTYRLRTLFSALIISLGVAMTLATEIVSSALFDAINQVGDGDLQITHGFVVEQFGLMLSGVSGVLIAATAFLIFNTFVMTITQRRRQIGLLRALGMTRQQTLRLVLLEAFLVGIIGVAIGLLLGPFIGQGIISMLRLLAGEFMSFGESTSTLSTWLVAIGLGLGVTLLAVYFPAREAAKISPLAALHDREHGIWSLRPKKFPVFNNSLASPEAVAFFAILALFTYLAVSPPGEWAFPPWNAWLTGLFLLVWLASLGVLLPALIRGIGWLAQRWWGRRSANGRLAADNLTRAPTRAALTTLTLAIGLTTIVGLTGIMTFTFDDLFGYTFNEMARQEMWAVFPFDLEQGIAGLSGVDALMLPPEQIDVFVAEIGAQADITPIRFASVPELSFMGRNYFTFVADPAALQDGFFTMIAGDWETAVPLMESGCGALVTPAVAQRNGLKVGDTFTITGAHGPASCTLAGIGAGFVNASIVGSAAAEMVGATGVVSLVITPALHADLHALIDEMQAIADRSDKTFVTSMRSYASLIDEVVFLFGIAMNGILLLAILAATLGVVNTMMMSVQERRQELGLLRTIGGTRRQVTAVVTGEAMLLGLAGGLFGLLAGAGIIIIVVVTYGGNPWGVPNLAVWPAAGRTLLPALRNGLVGLLCLPLVSAAAARWPAKGLLKGTAVQILKAVPEKPANFHILQK